MTSAGNATQDLERSGDAGSTRSIGGWLRNVPISDPVDRRNAPVVQVLLLLVGVLPPLMWLYRLFAVDIPWRAGETLSLLVSLGVSALALFSVVLIRRGRFQWAVRQILIMIAIAMMLSYVGNGMAANRFEQPLQSVWLLIAGLVISRRALWLMFFWTALSFGVGTWMDIQGGKVGIAAALLVDWLISVLIFLFIAVMVDRSVTALRESLREASLRADELARTNLRLKAEMEQREVAQQQLIHAQKVEAVGRLASGVAHDFNHLLSLVVGYVERGNRADSAADKQLALDGVMSAARRAILVSRKLLNFSRRDVAEPEIFDVAEALRDLQPMLRQLLDPSVRLSLELPEAAGEVPASVLMDRNQFDLIVLNIAANANQAMPKGGRFQVVLQSDPSQGSITLSLSDTGIGMDAEVLGRVFDSFFTTKPSGEGTGLGLTVAHDIVTRAGGRLVARSEPAKGACFELQLPRADALTRVN